MNLKKAFDTVDHEIPLTKFDCSGIRSILNNWFKSYLSNHKHFISVNIYGSELTEINPSVPQWSLIFSTFIIYK